MSRDTEEKRGSSRDAARALLRYLRSADYVPLAERQLLRRMGVGHDQRPEMRRLIRELVAAGRIVKGPGGRIVAATSGDVVTGTLQRHRDGFGFVAADGGGRDLFIPRRKLGNALSGDRVVARVTRTGRRGRPEGIIVETVGRRSRRVLGTMRLHGRIGIVQPFDSEMAEPIRIPGAFRLGASQDDVVHVELLRGPDSGRTAEGKILEVIGHLDDPGIDVTIVARRYGLKTEMSPEALAEAAELPSSVGPEEAGRRRFDDPPPVTIDGETAKDFDDAIAVQELRGGRFRLFVHIADVAHFVRPRSALDREAARRGTSVYFPDRVVPMLPEKLSNDLCSLRPGVDRLVQSVILEIDSDGALRRTRFADGVIRSAARLTYDQVSRVLRGERRVRGVPARVVPMLRAAGRLRELLEARRQERGSIDFDLPEPRILLDVEGVMTGITIEPRNEAHRLIEECMLAANEAVALHLAERQRPCMYRVHPPPDRAKLETLARFVEGFGLRLRFEGEPSPGKIQHLLARIDGRPEASVIALVALRSMKQARYSMENSGHFGLAAPTYCHFTSPIRRYPDLVVHRLLRHCRSRRRRASWEEGLDGVAESASELERNAEAAERELLTWKKITFIRDQVGERFTGIVTGVARFGLFVRLTENLVEGLLRVERLGDERFEFLDSRQELRGTISGRVYRLGDRLEVRVERVDRVLLRVDLSLRDDNRGASGATSRDRPAGYRRKRRAAAVRRTGTARRWRRRARR